ncbi:MAG: LptA/OstA family protein [Leptolyngbyaceae bacterium]|nr:LptA/OstA family protein [Leptolyngbyaceae bacterium]
MAKHASTRRHTRFPKLGTALGLVTVATISAITALSASAPLFSASAEEAQRSGQPLTLLSDIQEANAVTGVVTARGNVQIFYPAQNMQATSAQAQYYSREGRIVLTGDVFVLQDGNSIQGERVTYLIEEGRFEAMPPDGEQVQSVYLLPDEAPPASPVTAPTEDFNPKPEFKEPISP